MMNLRPSLTGEGSLNHHRKLSLGTSFFSTIFRRVKLTEGLEYGDSASHLAQEFPHLTIRATSLAGGLGTSLWQLWRESSSLPNPVGGGIRETTYPNSKFSFMDLTCDEIVFL